MALQNVGGTQLSDLIARPEFLAYTSERIFEQSKFIQAGVVQRNSALDARAGATRVRVPFFGAINPYEESIRSNNSWGDSGAGYLTSQSVSAGEQIMTILHRGFQYAVDDLSKLGTGADPLAHVRDHLATAINKLKTRTLKAQLDGLFGDYFNTSGVLSDNIMDVSAATTGTSANYLTASNVVKAKNKLGERGSELTAIAMHSNVAAYLEETGYLQVQVSGGNVLAASGLTGTGYSTFAGLRVIVDDQLSYKAGGSGNVQFKYPVFLFGNGIVAEGVQQDLRIETDRNKSSFQDLLIVDYHYGYHVLGTRWSQASDNPENLGQSNLIDTGSWQRAYDPKNIPLVQLIVNTPYDENIYD